MIHAMRKCYPPACLLPAAITALWAGSGCASAPQMPPPRSLDPDAAAAPFGVANVLRPGDVLNIHVWRQPEYSGEFEITSDGMIGHPLYGQVKGAGREVADVEEDLHLLLTRYLGEPSFVVEGSFRVAVAGEVRTPDVYTLPAQTTIADAIAQAGGPTQRARVDRVVLRRGGQSHVVDLTSPDVRLWDMKVHSGDEIIVERRVDAFREYVAPSAAVVGALAAVLRLII